MKWYNWVGVVISIFCVMYLGITGLIYVLIGYCIGRILSRG